MLLKVFGCTACIVGAGYLFLRNIFSKNQTSPVIIGGLLVIALLLFISAARTPKKQRQAAQAAQQQAAARAAAEAAHRAARTEASAAPMEKTITFNVAGTSFDNDDGTSRQQILRAIKFGDDPYAGIDGEKDVTIDETIFDGETALEVSINGYMVGYVPKATISQVKKALDTCTDIEYAADIVGGGRKQNGEALSYGCTVTMTCNG